MKKHSLFFLLLFVSFAAFFSSCVNHDYDLSDEKLDKNIVLSPDGVNMPVANIEQFKIFERIGYDNIQVNADGSLYIKYDGNFDPSQFKIPQYNFGTIPWAGNEDEIPVNFPASGTFTSLTLDQEVTLLSNAISYKVPIPSYNPDTDWEIVPEQINFDNLLINVEFTLAGIKIDNGTAELNLELTIPDNFTIEENGVSNTDGTTTITRSIDFVGNGTYQLKGIQLKSYKFTGGNTDAQFSESQISFVLKLNSIKNLAGTVDANPLFNISFTTDNDSRVINSVNGKVKGKVDFVGEVDGFGNLKSSFGTNAVLDFANPTLLLTATTNLGANFYFNIDGITADNKSPISLIGNNLFFTKPSPSGTTKATTYYVSPIDSFPVPADANNWAGLDLSNLFIPTIPEKISYNFSLNVDDGSATIMYDNLVLNGNYEFMLPFDFKNINVGIKIDPIFLDENLYDNILQYVKSTLTVQADTVIISADRFENLELTATIDFLTPNQVVVLSSNPITLEKGTNVEKLKVEFSKDDLEKLENANAQYLGIELRLIGKGALTKDDYIDIRGLRIKSDGGIHFEIK